MTNERMSLLLGIVDHHMVDAVRFTAFSMLQEARASMTPEQVVVYDEWKAERRSRAPTFVVA